MNQTKKRELKNSKQTSRKAGYNVCYEHTFTINQQLQIVKVI